MANSKVKKEAGANDKEFGGEDKKKFFANKGNRVALPSNKFEGKVEALKGYYYNCSDNKQSDMFVKTTKEIAGHVGRTYKNGGDVRLAVYTLAHPVFPVPADLPDDASKGQLRIWEKECDGIAKRKELLMHNIGQLYSLVWGQCTEIL